MSNVQFFTFANLVEDTAFDGHTVSRDDVKENMKALKAVCSNCHISRSNNLIKRCGQCKISRYYSPECQKADWPAHKNECRLASESRPIEIKLAGRAAANDTLMEFLDY